MNKTFIEIDINHIEHANSVYLLQQSSYQREAELINYPDLPPLRQSIDDLVHDTCKYYACRVDDDNSDVGILAYEEKNDAIYIHKVCVHPTYFHKGIATFLLDNLFQQNHQCKVFYVSTAKKNNPARKLYEKSGFLYHEEVEKPGITLVEYEKSQ